MSPGSAVASALAAATATAAAPAPPSSQNVLLWPQIGAGPVNLSTLPPVTDGPLDYQKGGPADEGSKRQRLCAVLSLGSTIQGVGELIAPIIDAATGSTGSSLSGTQVAEALVVYNAGYATAATLSPGFRLTLPIEVDATASGWVTSRADISSWATGIDPAGVALLARPAPSLQIPDPGQVRSDAEAELAAAATPGDLAAGFAPDLVENAFANVFRAIELMRQLRGDIYGDTSQAANEIPFVLAVLSRLRDYHLDFLAFGTAGNAILRRFWRALTSGDTSNATAADIAAAKQRVATALGLIPNAPGDWVEPTRWKPPATAAEVSSAIGPTVVPFELPLTPAQRSGGPSSVSLITREPANGRRAMVLGRDLYVGPPKLAQTKYRRYGVVYQGPAYLGLVDPVRFARDHATEIGTNASPLLASCVNVAIRIAGNEGYIDGCRAADWGILSTGMQQWSMHQNTEMPVLLARFQKLAWDHYDLFFGVAGIVPRMCGKAEEGKPPDDATVLAANPDLGTTFAGDFFPSYVTLDTIPKNNTPQLLPAPKDPSDTGNARIAFFGGKVSGKTVEFGNDWSARIRLAGRCSTEYGVLQVQTAAYRFKRILDGPGGAVLRGHNFNVDGVNHTLQELFVSEFAAATILDHHINVPGTPANDIAPAIARALPAGVTPHNVGTTTLDGRWLMRFAVDYLAGRRFDDLTKKGERDDRLLRLHDAGLRPDADPPTFPAWP